MELEAAVSREQKQLQKAAVVAAGRSCGFQLLSVQGCDLPREEELQAIEKMAASMANSIFLLIHTQALT